jgi:hypothetical protein
MNAVSNNTHSTDSSIASVSTLLFQEREALPPAAGDPPDRFWWRSKEALDTVYTLQAALRLQSTASHIVFLQDDVIVAPGYLQKLQQFLEAKAASNDTVDVVTLFTSNSGSIPVRVDVGAVHFGFVAVVFRRAVVEELVPYLTTRFSEAPVDWLLNDFLSSRQKTFWAYYPNLVQHVGVFSSLRGKKQGIASPTFGDRGCWIAEGSASSNSSGA